MKSGPIGGLGIHLVKTMMDELYYKRDQGKKPPDTCKEEGDVKLPAPLTTLGIGAAGVLLSLAFTSILACSQPEPAVNEVNSSTPASASQETRPTPSISESLAQAGQTNGVFDDRILFGQSAAFSGPARELGTNMRLGIQTAFHEVNENGGVHGRVLELISFDDAYEPEAAVNNTLRLIEQEEVFALIGEVGTPTSRSATPVAADAGIPFIAPFTGAEFLRNDDWQNIINLRASYYQETEEMVARLINDLGITRIGVLFQDDSYGRAGYRGVLFALDRRDLKPASIGLYPRNTTAIKAALLDSEPRQSGSGNHDWRIRAGGGTGVLGKAYRHRPHIYDSFLRGKQRTRKRAWA